VALSRCHGMGAVAPVLLAGLSAVGWVWQISNTTECTSYTTPTASPTFRGTCGPEQLVGQYGAFEVAPAVAATLAGPTIEVVRVRPANFSDIVNVEHGAAWFFVAPGSGLAINTTGMRLVECVAIQGPDPAAVLRSAGVDGCGNMLGWFFQLVLLSHDSQSACPADIPFVTPCVDNNGVAMNQTRDVVAPMCSTDCIWPAGSTSDPERYTVLVAASIAIGAWVATIPPWLCVSTATAE